MVAAAVVVTAGAVLLTQTGRAVDRPETYTLGFRLPAPESGTVTLGSVGFIPSPGGEVEVLEVTLVHARGLEIIDVAVTVPADHVRHGQFDGGPDWPLRDYPGELPPLMDGLVLSPEQVAPIGDFKGRVRLLIGLRVTTPGDTAGLVGVDVRYRVGTVEHTERFLHALVVCPPGADSCGDDSFMDTQLRQLGLLP